MWDINGMKILGNKFISLLNSTNPNENGIGVYAVNSKFAVNEFCTSIQTQDIPCPAANTTASIFEGLFCGVYVNNTFDLSSAQIRNTSFNNNLYGIRLEGAHNNYITKCDFNIPLAYIPEKTKYAFGIYSKLSSFKANTDNVFQNTGISLNGSVSSGKNMGVFIQDSELSSGIAQITGNTFNNLDVSIQLGGKNIALIDCNSFEHAVNGVDIHAANGTLNDQIFIDSNDNSPTGIYPMTNQFISNCNDPKVISNTSNLWFYLQKLNYPLELTSSCTTGNMIIFYNTNYPACSFYSDTHYQADLVQKTNSLISNIYDLKQIMQLGNRQELIELINNSCSGITSIKDTLLVHSPFLSDTIQKELLQSCYSFLDKKEILQSNMPLSDDVRLAVMNSTLPYWIKLILVSDDGRTPLEELKQEIEGKQRTLFMLESELINKYIDSAQYQISSWANSSPFLDSKMNQYLFSGVLAENNLLNALDTNILTPILADNLLFIQALENVKENNSLTFELIENNMSFISRKNRASKPILDFVDGYEINTNRNISTATPLLNTITRELASFGVSPNPATNRVTLSFNYKGLGKDMDVIDLNGTIVKSASTNEDVFNIDLNGLASGHYLIRVHYSDFSMPTEFEKLIILE